MNFRQDVRLGLFPTKDMQTPPPQQWHICVEDAHSAELNEKFILQFLQFLFFELWLKVLAIYQKFTGQKLLTRSLTR